MLRDSDTKSIWQETVPFTNINNTIDAVHYDVIIVGAGITGLSLGLALQEAGKRCLIVEAHSTGFGTTSGTTAHLNTVLDTPYTDIISKFGLDNAKTVAVAAAEAIATIKANVERYNIACDFEYLNGYVYAETKDEVEELDKLLAAINKVEIDAEYTQEVPIPMAYNKAIKFGYQAQFHPTHYLLGMLEAFQEKGGRVIENCRVEKLQQDNDIVTASCGEQSFTATYAAYATHIPPGLNLLHVRCAPYRSYVLGLLLDKEQDYPNGLVYDSKEPYHYFRTAYLEGKKVLLLGGNDHKTGHETNTEHAFTELEAFARNAYAVKEIVYKWSAQYYEPTDGLPYIGHLPGAGAHIFVATGYSGNGMIFGTLSGQIIKDLIVQGKSKYAKLFAPSRIKPIAGFKNFVKENADVAKRFITDRLSLEELEILSALSKEEGKIVKYQEQQIAIYKDEYGVVKALHPVCPHAGCIVQWNGAEKSWDCPCHGARYNVDGCLLNGPATADLKTIDLH